MKRIRVVDIFAVIGVVFGLAIAPGAIAETGVAAPNGTGVFVDMEGTVLTARHVVEGCGALYTVKDGRVVRAELVAMSRDADLALVRSATKPYLAATFAGGDAGGSSQPVFTAGYAELHRMKDRARIMSNGFAIGRGGLPGARQLQLFSEADHGASGSPVLDRRGLVIGLVVARRSGGGVGGQSLVAAVSETVIRSFLDDCGIAFLVSEEAQLSPLQPRAPRAATLSVGIICAE